jgi:hypothetical protein
MEIAMYTSCDIIFTVLAQSIMLQTEAMSLSCVNDILIRCDYRVFPSALLC